MSIEEIVELLRNSQFQVWASFFFLILCGFGLPMPEDIILLCSGFLAGKYGNSLMTPIIICYLGIMVGDSIIFLIGKYFGSFFLKSKLGKYILNEKRQLYAAEAFKKHGIWVNFFSRFLPGVRTAVFFTGGSLKYSFLKFFVMDGFAALLSVPLFVGLGYWIGLKSNGNIQELSADFKTYSPYIVALFLLLITVSLYLYFFRKKKK